MEKRGYIHPDWTPATDESDSKAPKAPADLKHLEKHLLKEAADIVAETARAPDVRVRRVL